MKKLHTSQEGSTTKQFKRLWKNETRESFVFLKRSKNKNISLKKENKKHMKLQT